METKMNILIIEEEKAEKSNFMHKYFDNLPQECKKKRDEKSVDCKLKVDMIFYDLEIYELSIKEKKLEFFASKSISIILVFNLDERDSFENLGNQILRIQSLNNETNLYILGSSINNKPSTSTDEVNALLQTCNFKADYNEIINFNQNSIESFFNNVIKCSSESLKTRKKADKSNISTSFEKCNIY